LPNNIFFPLILFHFFSYGSKKCKSHTIFTANFGSKILLDSPPASFLKKNGLVPTKNKRAFILGKRQCGTGDTVLNAIKKWWQI
jgi:hypothetical protein